MMETLMPGNVIHVSKNQLENLDAIKVALSELSKSDQQSVYQFMHHTLGLRMYAS